jgi:peroxiredoxin
MALGRNTRSEYRQTGDMSRILGCSRRTLLALPLACFWKRPTVFPSAAEPQRPDRVVAPEDDGACRHLPGMMMPDVELPSTSGRRVNLSKVAASRVVVYCYPMTAQPGKPLPPGWDDIPGARGCTAETCGFRDHHKGLLALGAEVFGVSTQTTAYQREMVMRLKVAFEVLSDASFALTDALRLPTFLVGRQRLIKRLTLILRRGRIEHVFYPVFPPDRHAEEVIAWLRQHPAR